MNPVRALLLCALVLAPAAQAQAATVSVSGSGQNKVIRVVDELYESSDLSVGMYDGELDVRELGLASLTPGPGCAVDPGGSMAVRCPVQGVATLEVDLSEGDDRLRGDAPFAFDVDMGGGDDEVVGDIAAGTVNGGEGQDAFTSAAAFGAVELHGGGGRDRISYLTAGAVDVSLDDVANDGSTAAPRVQNVHTDIEVVEGTYGADHLTGSAGPDELHGHVGADVLAGGGGDDVLVAGLSGLPEADSLEGEDGADTLRVSCGPGADAGPGDDTLELFFWCGSGELFGGDGTDTLDADGHPASLTLSLDDVADDGVSGVLTEANLHSDIERLIGGAGPDLLVGSDGANTIIGGEGDDLVDGAGGPDILEGGPGDDLVDYGSRTERVVADIDGAPQDDGETGEHDSIGIDVEGLLGGDGDDALIGGWSDDLIDGGPGADDIAGGDGFDVVDYSWRTAPVRLDLDGPDGEDGENDAVAPDVEGVYGGDGADVLENGAADGYLWGGPGDDRLTDTGGEDLIHGADGNDVVRTRDGEADEVDCGLDADTATLDDLDSADGCEAVDRPQPIVSPSPSPSPRPASTQTPVPTFGPLPGMPPGLHTDLRVVSSRRAAVVARQGLRFSVRPTRPATMSLRLLERRKNGKLLARGSTYGTPAAWAALSLKLTAAGRRALKARRDGKYVLEIHLTDALGRTRDMSLHAAVRKGLWRIPG